MSHHNRLDVSPLLLPASGNGANHVSVSIAHVTSDEEAALGRLFVLVSLKHPQSSDIASLITESIKSNYYSQLDGSVDIAFENALRLSNERIHQYIQSTSGEWLDDLSVAVAVLHERTLTFSHLGSIRMYLLQRGHMVDILETSQTAQDNINPLKLFSHTVSGELQEGDRLFICTASLLDYLSLDRMSAILTKNSPSMASVNLERLLSPNAVSQGFGGIIIRLLPSRIVDRADVEGSSRIGAYTANVSQASMVDLHSMEARAGDVLRPSVVPLLRRGAARVTDSARDLLVRANIIHPSERRRSIQAGQPMHWSRREPRSRGRVRTRGRGVYILSKVLAAVLVIGRGIGKGIAKLWSIIRGRENIRKRIEHIPQRAEHSVSRKVIQFRQLSRRQRLYLFVSIALVFVFALTIILRGQSQTRAEELRSLENAYATAMTDLDDAGAAILYGDEMRARELLTQAEQAVGTVPARFEDNLSDEQFAYSQALNDVHVQLRRETVVSSPNAIATVPAESTQLLSVNDAAVLTARRDATVDTTSRTDGEPLTVLPPDTTDGASVVFSADRSPTSIILFLANNQVLTYDPTGNTLSSLEIGYENVDRTIRGGDIYANRLYLLDTQNNNIFRHAYTSNAFGTGVSWLTDLSYPVTEGVSLTVDGSIYVLNNDGTVNKYFAGAPQEFAITQVDPTLTTPTIITTNEELDNLYILDPDNNRFLVFSKAGRFIRQYSSETWDDLRDLSVENDTTIYLLNGSSVVSVTLETES